MSDPILSPLNEAQHAAVTAPPGPTLVLAGAGCGKTRVLIHRLAWLIEAQGVSPWAVMAVTFTNKAAGEMKARAEALLSGGTRGLWLGTFHGLAHRFLRQHWREADLPEGFQILDSDDQQRLVKRLMKQAQVDDSRWPVKSVAGFINARKEEGLRASRLEAGDTIQAQLLALYRDYEAVCQRSGLVDFNELLLRALETLTGRPELQAHYRERFQHLLVDEFQDTNALQYRWLKALAGAQTHVFAVGDDDQSIYGWRGARIEHILEFERDFPGTRTVRLERNYRSTQIILNAANTLIANNRGRLGKTLFTEGHEGEPIDFFLASSADEEGRFVAERLSHWRDQGGALAEAAVLYRSNAQSRLIEEALIGAQLPYRVYGGLRFFERAEIKDALAYLRLLANRDDDAAFERVVNTPARGIGEKTLEAVRAHARRHAVSLWQATQLLLAAGQVSGRTGTALRGFLTRLEEMAGRAAGADLPTQVQRVIEDSGLLALYRTAGDDRGEARAENLEEMVSAARAFANGLLDPVTAATRDNPAEEAGLPPLAAFLAHAALEAGEAQADAHQDCVQLMTLHAAKGLEFKQVFLIGLEEGLFPHQMSADDPNRLEEERRLAYVGLTRAREKLHLTACEHRFYQGREFYPQPSRFLRELPPAVLRELRPRIQHALPMYRPETGPARPAAARAPMQSDEGSGFRIGQNVRHPRFGEGVITAAEGRGPQARVQVHFRQGGAKWLVLAYASLQSV